MCAHSELNIVKATVEAIVLLQLIHMANFSGFDHMYIYEFRDLLYLYRTMQVKSCVDLSNFSSSSSHGKPQELVARYFACVVPLIKSLFSA